MLKTLAKDAATVLVVLVCVAAVVITLFVVTYGLMLLFGRVFL